VSENKARGEHHGWRGEYRNATGEYRVAIGEHRSTGGEHRRRISQTWRRESWHSWRDAVARDRGEGVILNIITRVEFASGPLDV
jgi:hypothetical protein